jgi:hypothetical protein
MDTPTPRVYLGATLWWQHEAEGYAGQPLRSFASPAKLEAIIAARRASCSARMKGLRSRSERSISRLLSQR